MYYNLFWLKAGKDVKINNIRTFDVSITAGIQYKNTPSIIP